MTAVLAKQAAPARTKSERGILRHAATLVLRWVTRLVAFVLLVGAVASAAGFFRVMPAGQLTGHDLSWTTAVVIKPCASVSLAPGDKIVIANKGEYKLTTVEEIIDSGVKPRIRMEGMKRSEALRFGPKTWCTTAAVPGVGIPLAAMAGSAQSIVVVVVGLILVAWSQRQAEEKQKKERRTRHGRGDGRGGVKRPCRVPPGPAHPAQAVGSDSGTDEAGRTRCEPASASRGKASSTSPRSRSNR